MKQMDKKEDCRTGVWRVADVALAVWLAGYAFVVVTSEILSLFAVFRPCWIQAVWLAAATVIGGWAWRRRGRIRRAIVCPVRWPRTFTEWCLAAAAGATFVCAVLAPTSEADALTYHLARIPHWLVNGSTGFYETAVFRQNFQPPGFSLCAAQLMAVCGGDRLVNLLQWFSWWLLAGSAGLVAAELGAGERGRRLAALLALTLPQAVAQSTLAIADLFSAVPMMAFALYLLRAGRGDGRRMWGWCLAAGGALGLACLAKWTCVVYGAAFGMPLGMWLVAHRWREGGGIRAAAGCAAALCAAAALGVACIGPQMAQNARAYGDLFSGEPKQMMTVKGLTPGLFAVNTVRNAASHLALPFRALNQPLERMVRRMCGDAADDPRITMDTFNMLPGPYPFKVIATLGKNALYVSNPLHVILFAVALCAWMLRPRGYGGMLVKIAAPVVVGGILTCMFFKWQPAAVRLTIPLYGLMAAGVGVWLAGRQERDGRLCVGVLAVCAAIQAAAQPMWYMPAFLLGKGTETSGITFDMTVGDKVRHLAALGWPAEELAEMRATVPECDRKGYSLFYTPRQRQVLGNWTYNNMVWKGLLFDAALTHTAQLREEPGVSRTVGLLVSSDHGNLPPDSKPAEMFAYEYPMWTWGGGEAGRGDWRLEHFGASDPTARAREIFGAGRGVILSDKTRESVIARLGAVRAVSLVYSNEVFNVYSVETER